MIGGKQMPSNKQLTEIKKRKQKEAVDNYKAKISKMNKDAFKSEWDRMMSNLNPSRESKAC
jgi:hypothetical protein